MDYEDYIRLERAYIRKDKRTVRRMIGDKDALTVLAELDERFESGG